MHSLLEQGHVDVAVGDDCSHWAHAQVLLCLDHIEVVHSEKGDMDCGLLVVLESSIPRNVVVQHRRSYLEVGLVSRKDSIADDGLGVVERAA